jgi:HSP20 family protein
MNLTMAQWNPLHDLVSLQDRMNRLFEDASQRRAGEAERSDEVENADWYPAADVYENETEYTVAVDLPGIERSTLDISLDGDRLTIKGERVDQGTTQHQRECPAGKFLRTFSVPGSVDRDSIRAEYKDGVLQVHLPKQPERKPQRVEIKIS